MRSAVAPKEGFAVFLDREMPEVHPVAANESGKLPRDKTVQLNGETRVFWRWHYNRRIVESLAARETMKREERAAIANGTLAQFRAKKLRAELAKLEAADKQ